MSPVQTLSTKSVLPRVPIPLHFAVVSAWATRGLALATAVFALGPRCRSRTRDVRRTELASGGVPMRKPGLFAHAAARILTGVGTWVASATRARVALPIDVSVDPMQIMKASRQLPAQQRVDLSLVFERTE